MENEGQNNPIRPPKGIFQSRCDEKGRVRLPKEIEEFIKNAFSDTEYFVTTIDSKIARVYPMQVWERNEKLLNEDTEDREAAEDLQFFADYYGAVTGIDSQGRILMPTLLRRKLEIEDQKVLVRYSNDAIDVFSDAGSNERLARAETTVATKLGAMKSKGLK